MRAFAASKYAQPRLGSPAMDEQAANPEEPASDQAEQIEVTQEVIQGLLEMLGEAWEELTRLRAQTASLKGAAAPPTPHQLPALGEAEGGAPALRLPAEAVGADDVELAGVLIIDDSKLLQARLKSTVESLGYEVIGLAENGEAGLRLALSKHPRLIILDYDLPVLNGLECLKLIRERRPDTTAIVCSGKLTAQLSHEFIRAGVTELLSKPVQLNLLIQAIHRAMG